MASTKWQCSQCGVVLSTSNGLRPPIGAYCGRSKDKRHHWSKVIEKPTRWQCTQCGTTQRTSNGVKPPIGAYCGRSKDGKHHWRKV